jgi:hypothetical protein
LSEISLLMSIFITIAPVQLSKIVSMNWMVDIKIMKKEPPMSQ